MVNKSQKLKKLLEKQTHEQYSGKCILLLATPDQQKKCHKSWQIHLWSTRPNNVLVSFKVVNIQQDAGRELKSHMHRSGQSKFMILGNHSVYTVMLTTSALVYCNSVLLSMLSQIHTENCTVCLDITGDGFFNSHAFYEKLCSSINQEGCKNCSIYTILTRNICFLKTLVFINAALQPLNWEHNKYKMGCDSQVIPCQGRPAHWETSGIWT